MNAEGESGGGINAGLIGLYGLYLIFVGIKGNAATLTTQLGRDAKPFFTWILAIVILRGLYNVESIRPLVKPFIGLAVLTFTLKNFSVLGDQVNQITGKNFFKVKKS
jgi:hypothetical protein